MNKTTIILSFACFAVTAFSASTIDPANPYGHGANVGWINARGNGFQGAVIGQYFCSGYLYGANAGWISLGNGSPTNGMAYANNAGNDYGINHDGLGRLTGYAYGANIRTLNQPLETNILYPVNSYTDTLYNIEKYYRLDVQID